jgi:hypothetical protein
MTDERIKQEMEDFYEVLGDALLVLVKARDRLCNFDIVVDDEGREWPLYNLGPRTDIPNAAEAHRRLVEAIRWLSWANELFRPSHDGMSE